MAMNYEYQEDYFEDYYCGIETDDNDADSEDDDFLAIQEFMRNQSPVETNYRETSTNKMTV